MMRAVRDGMIMSPSLTISKDEIDEMFSKFKVSLDQTLEKIK
jgi:adenosylmethionine-8-amino-7-oxononanoate aminotransferase